jgi:hypothetical protein
MALSYPIVMVVMALAVGPREAGDLQDVVAIFGAVTSLPLWYLLGTALAVRSETWGRWLRRYVTIAVVWTLANLGVLAVVAMLTG